MWACTILPMRLLLLRMLRVDRTLLVMRDFVRQTEQMGSELSMLHAQAGEYKYEIGRVTKELRETKKKYFEQKKREQKKTGEDSRFSAGCTSTVLVYLLLSVSSTAPSASSFIMSTHE